MFQKIIKDTSVSSLGTLISRLLGFVRDIIFAYWFGTSVVLEAFLVAFRLPNLFRSIFGEGFADSIAVPVMAEYRGDKRRIFEMGNQLNSLFFVVLSAVTALGIIFSKYLVLILAPGFLNQADKFNLAVSFTRITFVYLLLIALSVNLSTVLYSLKKFFIPSVTPAFLNISFIIGIIFFSRFFEIYILVFCVVAAGVLQIIFPYIFLRKEGFFLKFEFKNYLKDQDIIRMIKLLPPRVWASVSYHLSVILDTVLCSFSSLAGQGALAAVHYASHLIQFPLAFIVLSISRVIIVDLSSCYKEEKMDDFKKIFVFSFQNIVFFIIPISVIFMFLPREIIDVLYKRGGFDMASLAVTSSLFFSYALGLFFFCFIKLQVTAFYALKDTLVPARTTTTALLINAVSSVLLMFPFKAAGVALGSSLAAGCNVIFLHRALIRKIGWIDWQDTKLQFIKVFVLSILSGSISRVLWGSLGYSRYLKLAVVLGVVSVIFIIGGDFLGVKQIRYVKGYIFKRK